MKPIIELYDTTLRDGSQGEGINFSALDKLRIAEKLDSFGFHYIEGGWPGSNPKDMEFFTQAARRKWKNADIAAFSMTRRKGLAVESDELMRQVLAAETPVATIVGKSWLLHVHEVLRAKPDENIAMIADTIRFLKDHGKRVIYDAEHAFDGYKDQPEYALSTWQAAEHAGAECVVLCDTNGGCLPQEISEIVGAARKKLTVRLGIHTHNDTGLGVANALAGLQSGATHVQGTVNGYGERTGNCNMITVIPLLQFKLKEKVLPDKSLPRLKELSEFVDEIANVRHDPRQPWVGQTAFAHKGGMHVHAVDRVARSYEHIDPESVGNQRRVLVSDMAGRTNILMKAAELGFKLAPEAPETRAITAEVKRLEGEGYEYEAAEGSLALLIRKTLKHQEPPFQIEGYHVSMRRDRSISVCQASVKVKVDGETEHTIAEGDGPVNALDGALRRALIKFFPQLKRVQLEDYKVRILNSTAGTGARTRVLIESTDGKEEWGTVGVHDNIIEASVQALSDSFEYRLTKK
ncbi:MAG TPA: citramalate synthase [Verrucomicrobiae bacterium]|nr:citramalate synthase [Verrucomicrobiae bacterium]